MNRKRLNFKRLPIKAAYAKRRREAKRRKAAERRAVEDAVEQLPYSKRRRTAEDTMQQSQFGIIEAALVDEIEPIDEVSPLVELNSNENNIAAIINEHINDYLKSGIGGGKPDDYIALYCKRIAMLLEYTGNLNATSLVSTNDVFGWVRKLVTTHSGYIEKHAEYLLEVHTLSYNTVRTYITVYGTFFKWYVLHFCIDENALLAGDYCRIQHVIASLSKFYNKEQKKSKVVTNHSIEQLIADMKWPANGLLDLKEALQARVQFARAVANAPVSINKDLWLEYIQFLIVHWYTNAPSARIQGFNTLTVRDGLILLEKCKLFNE